MVSALAAHLPHVFETMRPLRAAAKGTGRLLWSDALQDAFVAAKQTLTSPHVVVPFDPSRELLVLTDYSGQGMAGALVHIAHDHTHLELIECWSKTNTPAQSRYTVQSGELDAFRQSVKRWPHYIRGRHVFWITDAKTMSEAVAGTSASSSKRIDRTLAELQNLDVSVVACPGKLNTIVDSLSRDPSFVSEMVQSVEEIK